MSFVPFRRFPAIAAVLLALLLASCGSDTAETGGGTTGESPAASGGDGATAPSTDPAVTGGDSAVADGPAADTAATPTLLDTTAKPAAPPVGQRYNVRSGVVELKSSTMGDLKQTIYFDDYGQKEVVIANISSGGTTTRAVMVRNGQSSVVYDPERKTGARVDLADALSQMGLGGIPNLSSLDERSKQELKYREIAGRTVLGKQTQGALIEVVGTPVKVWSWQGIPLRMEAAMQGNQMVVEATSLKTDVPVAAERFVVPGDIKITDLKPRQ